MALGADLGKIVRNINNNNGNNYKFFFIKVLTAQRLITKLAQKLNNKRNNNNEIGIITVYKSCSQLHFHICKETGKDTVIWYKHIAKSVETK